MLPTVPPIITAGDIWFTAGGGIPNKGGNGMVMLEGSEGEYVEVVDINTVGVPVGRVVDKKNALSSSGNLVSV
jgi:hypothetical protein